MSNLNWIEDDNGLLVNLALIAHVVKTDDGYELMRPETNGSYSVTDEEQIANLERALGIQKPDEGPAFMT